MWHVHVRRNTEKSSRQGGATRVRRATQHIADALEQEQRVPKQNWPLLSISPAVRVGQFCFLTPLWAAAAAAALLSAATLLSSFSPVALRRPFAAADRTVPSTSRLISGEHINRAHQGATTSCVRVLK